MSSDRETAPVKTIRVRIGPISTDNTRTTSQQLAVPVTRANTGNGPETSTSIAPSLVYPVGAAANSQPFHAVLVNLTGSDGALRQAIQLKEVATNSAHGKGHNDSCIHSSTTQASPVEENVSSISSSQGSGESSRSKDMSMESPTQFVSDCDPPATKRLRLERQTSPSPYTAKTERAKQYNLFIRQLVDSHLDKRIPISLQPRERIQEIIEQASSDFPDFADCTRKRIRTYLKTCRKSKSKGETSQLFDTPTVFCDQRVPSTASSNSLTSPSVSFCVSSSAGMTNHFTENNYTSIKQLIQGYKQSATFLIKAAAELEQLLPPSSLSPLL